VFPCCGSFRPSGIWPVCELDVTQLAERIKVSRQSAAAAEDDQPAAWQRRYWRATGRREYQHVDRHAQGGA